jgi:hypothetical protein
MSELGLKDFGIEGLSVMILQFFHFGFLFFAHFD